MSLGLSDSLLQAATYWGFDLITYLKHNLSFPGLPTSKLRNLNPLSFVLQPSTHVCSIWHCRKFFIIPLAIFKGPNICYLNPMVYIFFSDVNGQNHVGFT
jgi:hypothetical protein